MILKNSKRWLVVLASVGLITVFQGAAFADSNWLESLFGSTSDPGDNQNGPDQNQIQADQAYAAQVQAAYQNNQNQLTAAQQQLRQDQRAGVDTSADRKNIQNIWASLTENRGRIQASAQDLAKDGVANPYTVPTYVYDRGYPSHPDRQWERRGSYPGYVRPEPRWNRGSRHDEMHYNEHRRFETH